MLESGLGFVALLLAVVMAICLLGLAIVGVVAVIDWWLDKRNTWTPSDE